jgi:hypothetical protein
MFKFRSCLCFSIIELTLFTEIITVYFEICKLFIFYIHSSYTVLLLCRSFSFSLDLYTIGRAPWTSDRSVARPLPKYRKPGSQKNAHTHTHQTSMPEVRFEPTIKASERAKTGHASDRWATVTGEL